MKYLVYFKDVINYGDLYIDYSIIEDDYPLLFILKNKHNDRFICSCFEIIKQQSWVINKVTISNIKDLLTDKIDIRKAFLFDNDDKKVIVHKKNNKYIYKIVDKEYIINNDIIPDEGDYLESDENEFNEYIINLEKTEKDLKYNENINSIISIEKYLEYSSFITKPYITKPYSINIIKVKYDDINLKKHLAIKSFNHKYKMMSFEYLMYIKALQYNKYLKPKNCIMELVNTIQNNLFNDKFSYYHKKTYNNI